MYVALKYGKQEQDLLFIAFALFLSTVDNYSTPKVELLLAFDSKLMIGYRLLWL